MDDYMLVSSPIEYRIRLSKHDGGKRVDLTLFKSLVGSLHYLTYTRSDILYVIGLVNCYMETPTTSYFQAANKFFAILKIQLTLVYFTYFLIIISLLDSAIATGVKI